MKIGYIHTNKEEQARVMQVVKMLSEPVALDELGIGRLRDAFSDLMFPGISTLQKHMKYFSLLPQLYRKATEKRYNRPSEVHAEIIRLERIMTKNLYDGSEDKRGITGSEVINQNSNNYVKYDPAYIYNSGLQTFEILRNPQIEELIYSTSKQIHSQPKRYKSDNEDNNDDTDEKSGVYQFCSFPNVNYDFTVSCSTTLTKEDKDFIVDHILKAKACQGTLLRYIVENEDLPLADSFPGIEANLLPESLRTLQRYATQFSDFMYIIHLRYNCIYSKENGGIVDEKILAKFKEELDCYNQKGINIDKILSVITLREKSSILFCHECAIHIADKNLQALDECIVRRERRIKGTRRKLGNPSYTYDPRYPIHNYKLSFRWETIKTFVDELRKEASNG